MVNRILIRIKVVQMLYSYLLTRTEFKIDTDPDTTSADRRFAHTAYVDLLLLLLELTGHNTVSINAKSNYVIDKKLAASALGNSLARDTDVRSLIVKGGNNIHALASLIQPIADAVADSAVFKDYRRKRKIDVGGEVALWTTLFESVIARNTKLIEAFRAMPGFTNVGYDMAIAKVVETLKSYYGASAGYYNALKALETSLSKAYELYLSMFMLIGSLTRARENQLETAKAKYLATAEDKNPNTRFIDNEFAAALAADESLAKAAKEYGISWDDDYDLLQSLLEKITSSKIYEEYMSAPTTDWQTDCEFWRQILRTVVFTSDVLEDVIETKSVYWNDDLQIMGTFVLKTIRQAAMSDDHKLSLLPQFKDEEDASFGAELFEKAVQNRDTYYGYIEQFVDTTNWDADRLAFMDSVIMIAAVTEIINYPNIPLAVSFNEYIDIANAYSSAKSGQFVNGILYSVVKYLNAEGIIHKA